MVTVAKIRLYGKPLGAVVWNPELRTASFEYEPAFLKSGIEISPFRLPLQRGSNRIFSFPELKDSSTFKGLPGLLADTLPDSYGSALIDAWLAKNGRPSGSMNPVEQLLYIGKRGVGALEFEPAYFDKPDTATRLEVESLVAIAGEILSERTKFSKTLSEKKESVINDIFKIGTSAGGARAKALIAYNSKTGEVRSGQAAAPNGFSHWLLKFDGVTDRQSGISTGYGRVEYAYYLMAVDAGIVMMESRLLEENGRAHFITRRFDRYGGKKKVFYQSFCGLMHYDFRDITSYSYEQLFETMRMLRLPYAAAEQMFRRMVFNVIARNCDDHTKNFAFILPEGGKWQLAPAYDLCYSYRPDSPWVSRHCLSINGKRTEITREDILILAGSMNIKKPERIIEQIAAVVHNWKSYAATAGVKPVLTKLVQRNLVAL